MDDLSRGIASIAAKVDEALGRLNIGKLSAEIEELKKSSEKSDFWSDRTKAEGNMKQQARLSSRLEPWLALDKEVKELEELAKLKDASLKADLTKQLEKTKESFEKLKQELKFSGPFDDYDAILSLHAGAGGVDAQDWTDMLLRMYLRWAQGHGFHTKTLNQSAGEEAGLKSVDIEISGSFAYGKLKGEHGVHRLVRLSPYNSDNLRQTSFAKVEVMPKIDRPADLEIDEKDLKIDVFRSGGRGGQSVNTTDSAVRITHTPTGVSVSIQNERSQQQNKELAMTVLRSKLAQLRLEQHQEKLDKLKGPNQSAEWGNQIRSYVLHPYKQVKDMRTKYESKDPAKVLDGELDGFIEAYLENSLEA